MYDELVKALRIYANDETDELRFEAADAIEELQAAEKKYLANISALEAENQHLKRERDWIPVTEQPPEKKEIYWCYTNQGSMCECRWTNDRYGLGASDRWGWNVMDVPQYQKITHWMPLPQPPKEE